jgi:hypothetical protein
MRATMNAKTPKPDDVLRRMLNTPPKPHAIKAKPKKTKKPRK